MTESLWCNRVWRARLLARRCLPLVALAPALAACYRYTPTDVAAVRPGEHVRAHLTAVEADRIAPVLGGNVVRRFDGVLVRSDSAALLLEVPAAQRAPAGSTLRLHQQIAVGRDGVAHVELRQLDRMRTGAMVALGAVAIGVVVAAWVDGPSGDGLPGGFEVPEARRHVTLLRFAR